MRYSHLILSVLLSAMFITSVSCSMTQQPSAVERDVFAMDTFMTMKAYGDRAEKALEAADKRIHELEKELSVTDEDSDIFRINNSNGFEVTVSEDTTFLINESMNYWNETKGRLDISVYPLVAEWGFTTGEYHVPDTETISKLLNNVNGGNIKISDNTVQIPSDSKIDLGAIAKGYTGDQIIEIFRNYEISSALISLGGNVQALGRKPDGSPWRVAIKDPFSPEDNMCVVNVSDKAVVTSGNYERFFTDENGNEYWHIIDPYDGYPADNGLVSVTVIGESGMRCDALSTALFVAGTTEAKDYLKYYQEVEAVLVTDDARILYTEGLNGRIDIKSDMQSEVIMRD